jgi:dTDP-4-dehydrorhamnose reductase
MHSKKKWLVLGGSGQLGKALEFDLDFLQHHDQIHIPKNLDIRKFQETHDLIEDLQPDYIVNCAAWTVVRAAESYEFEANLVNGEAVSNIGLAASKINATLIHVSTDYVFSGNSKNPYTEEDATNPINAYGRSKALGESLLEEVGIEKMYILRTAWLYGKHRKNFIKTILQKYLNGERTIEIVDDQFGNPTYALDLASCIVEIGKSTSSYGIYHVTNTGETSWFGFAKEAFEILGVDTEVLRQTKTSYREELKRPRNSSLDTAKWNSSGLTPLRSWQDALESSINDIYNQVRTEGPNAIQTN